MYLRLLCMCLISNAYNYVFDVDGYVTRKYDHYNTSKGDIKEHCVKYLFSLKCCCDVIFAVLFDAPNKRSS